MPKLWLMQQMQLLFVMLRLYLETQQMRLSQMQQRQMMLQQL
jgi:hypothetical protein